jgi:hypothetical protein
MKAGRWLETHQGIAFDTDGRLIDGRHRLMAVAASGVTVRMWVFPEQTRETFDVIDTGYARAAAQFLPSTAPSMAAGAVRYIAAVIDKDFKGIYRNKMPLHEVLEAHRQWPEIENWTLATYGARSVAAVPPSPLLAIVAMGERGGVPAPVIADFLSGLKSGAIGDAHDPRLLLRNRFIRDSQGPEPDPRLRAARQGLQRLRQGRAAQPAALHRGGPHPPALRLTWNGERLRPRSAAA